MTTTKQIDLDQFDKRVIGQLCDDPLRNAFDAKHSAHADGSAIPVPPEQQPAIWQELMASDTQDNKKRCLYIHIPFCRVRCTYCNFFQNAASRQLVDDYFAALMVEIKLKAALPWVQSGTFHAVYVGGGTPTDLSAQQIRTLGNEIRKYFPLTNDCEITLEGRINRFSDEVFEQALEGGFNRFSFGIQSFNTQVRRAAKRLDERDAAMERISTLSAMDQAPIVVDLLYGLPHQTLDVLQQDLRDYIDTGAHGVDLYQLIVAPNAPMVNLIEKGKLPAPATSADKAAMYQYGVEFFAEQHLRQLSVNHWATDNRERSLYNSLAKTYADVLPLGCGAGGHLGGYSFMQHRNLQAYMGMIKHHQDPLMVVMKQHPLEPLFATLKSGFDRGVILRKQLSAEAKYDYFEYLRPLFNYWEDAGLVSCHEQSITLTIAGQFWSVNLAQACIHVIQNNLQIVSVAV